MIIAVLASGTEYRDEMRAGDSSRTSGEAPPATPLPSRPLEGSHGQ